MTKKEIGREVSIRFGTKHALSHEIVQYVLDAIVTALEKDGRIAFRGFGIFQVKARAARMGRDPRTNTPVPIPPKSVVVFHPGKSLAKRAADFDVAERASSPTEPLWGG